MPGLPKLKVTHWIDGQAAEETLEFEQAPYFLFDYDVLVIVEGRVIRSYEELLQLVSEKGLEGRDVLEVRMETVIGGG